MPQEEVAVPQTVLDHLAGVAVAGLIDPTPCERERMRDG